MRRFGRRMSIRSRLVEPEPTLYLQLWMLMVRCAAPSVEPAADYRCVLQETWHCRRVLCADCA
jgi:hypothetical protein